MSDLISVIIPIYNHARTIKKCLLSIKNQTYQPIETIVVNDGSTDDFKKIMAEILSTDEFKKFPIQIINQENKGAPSARNRGFDSSVGGYVIFWDADIIARPDAIARLKSALDENLQTSYAYSQFKFGWKKMKSHEFDPELLRQLNYINTTSLIRRVDFPRFDESLKRFQDWDLWLTMLANKKTGVLVPEVLYQVIVGGRAGISSWLPSFVYKFPWKTTRVKKYEAARAIVVQKHKLSSR